MSKSWSLLVHLTMNMWESEKKNFLDFDEEAWNEILKMASSGGIDTIVLDVGDGLMYDSHPEISLNGAWSKEKLSAEIKKANDMGMAMVPKLNFSAFHDMWLWEYGKMVSTKTYYKVCEDLINEVFQAFNSPEYIHLGMDEEDAAHFPQDDGVFVCRFGKQLWYDLNFLLDTVRKTGATPWMWADCLFTYPEEFKKNIKTDDLLLSPWYYHALKEEHFTPISSRQEYVDYYSKGVYANMGLTYVEDDMFHSCFRKNAIPSVEYGYRFAPCVSVFNKCEYNTPDMVEYFKEKAPDENVHGFMTAPWCSTKKENLPEFESSIKLLKAAKEKFYR